jgi:hypothetical protein
MKAQQTYFAGSVAIGVQTAHGIETRYVEKNSRPVSVTSLRSDGCSAEKPEGKPAAPSDVTRSDRTPQPDWAI